MSAVAHGRHAWCTVDLDAVRANVTTLRSVASPAQLMAVVKADGYGHGAVPVATAALEAGATWLGVAVVDEGAELRAAGLDAPIMVLSEPAGEVADTVVEHRLTPVVHSHAGVAALAKAVADRGTTDPLGVHLKVDTGMHRVGCAPGDTVALARAIGALDDVLRLDGMLTHLAVADEPDDPYTAGQLAAFDQVLGELARRGVRPPLVHIANSAGALAFPEARRDLVRCGIAVYGGVPSPQIAVVMERSAVRLRPALTLSARITHVQRLAGGERLGYGLRHTVGRGGATVAVVALGYGDGVPRRLGAVGGEVLVRGRRHRVAGTVSMDQMTLDCGDAPVEVGDEVVLIGRQGDDEVTATEWAERLGTVAYEVVCGIGARVPRRYA